jgi:hypothetical protein
MKRFPAFALACIALGITAAIALGAPGDGRYRDLRVDNQLCIQDNCQSTWPAGGTPGPQGPPGEPGEPGPPGPQGEPGDSSYDPDNVAITGGYVQGVQLVNAEVVNLRLDTVEDIILGYNLGSEKYWRVRADILSGHPWISFSTAYGGDNTHLSFPLYRIGLNADGAHPDMNPEQVAFGILDKARYLLKLFGNGDLDIPGEISARSFNSLCNPLDNECAFNSLNSGPPADNTPGNCGYDNTADGLGCWNKSGVFEYYGSDNGSMVYPGAGIPQSTGSAWGASLTLDTDLGTVSGAHDSVPSALAAKTALDAKAPITNPIFSSSAALPQGGSPTVDAAGEVAVDTTGDQLLYYSDELNVVSPLHHKGFTIVDPTASHSPKMKAIGEPWTVTALSCITDTGTLNVELMECSSSGTGCVTTGLLVTADSDGQDDTTTTNASIDAGDWLQFVLSSLSGSPGEVSCTWSYRVTRQ